MFFVCARNVRRTVFGSPISLSQGSSRRWHKPGIWLFYLVLAFATAVPGARGDSSFDSQLDELMSSVYCYCGCVKETIQVCVCGTAVAVEADFRGRLNAGETVGQIRADYLETYGPQFYALMPAEGINLIAYIAPAVILILIGGVALAILLKLRKPKVATEQPRSTQVSDAAVEQIEAELEKYKQEK